MKCKIVQVEDGEKCDCVAIQHFHQFSWIAHRETKRRSTVLVGMALPSCIQAETQIFGFRSCNLGFPP